MTQRICYALCLVFTFTVISLNAEAKIWRVNNMANATNGSNLGGTAANPVFMELFGPAATSAASSTLVLAGDTVYLEGSTADYDGGNLTKKLVIIGPGYFLNENPNTSNNVLSAILNYITFNNGSSGSQIIGVHVGNHNFGVIINVSEILVRRCRIDVGLNLSYGISDIKILQNFFTRTTTATVIETHSFGFPSDFIFNYNIVLGPVILPVGYAMLECKNNVFAGPAVTTGPALRMFVGSFQNNIITNPAVTVNINDGTNLNATYNTCASASQIGSGTGNTVANMSTLFVASGTSDGKYQLRPGSVAGSDGTDRGAFGGTAPSSRYTLSGLTPIPVVYDIASPGVATPSGLQVTIKARTIN